MSKPLLKPKPGKVKVFQAISSYDSKNSDELSFKQGDYLYVCEQSADGWWKARCAGKTGYIPCTYVTEKEEIKQPLHDAARRGNLLFLENCIAQGVSHTSLDAMSNTALYWAASSGHLDCLQLLLSLPNPPVNAQNHVGDTALHSSASRGHIDIVKALISHGSDVALVNLDNETAEDLAKDAAIKNILQISRQSRNSMRVATYQPQDYDDEDSDS